MDRGTTHRVGERFRLGRVLKASASGTVYVAAERDNSREVVVKIIGLNAPLPPDPVRTRFQRALSLLGEIAHPAFPTLIEVGWASASEAYLITTLVQGTPLPETGMGDTVRTLALLMRVGEALDRLHTAGSAHLNVAPDNVLITPDNAVKLVGLGSGWLPGAVTRSEFAAPELATGSASTQPWRADIFSFARTICGALGLAAVPEGSERFIVELSGDVGSQLTAPRRFREVLEQSLHRQPEERPSSLSEVLRALESSIGLDLLRQVNGAEAEIDDGEPLDQTAKIDLETVARLRAERDARRNGAAAPASLSAAEPPGTAPIEAHQAPDAPGGLQGPTAAAADTEDHAALERTTRIDVAQARIAAEGHGVTAEPAGDGPAEAPPAAPKKRSPDTAPIPLPPSLAQPRPQSGEDTDTKVAAGTSPDTTGEAPPQEAAAPAQDDLAADDDAPVTSPIAAMAAAKPLFSQVPRPWMWVALAVSALGLALVFWLATTPRHARDVDTTPASNGATIEPVVTAPTAPAARQLIDQAESALTDGDASAAELALAGLTTDQVAALSRQERERIMAIRTAIAERRRWDRVRTLDAALANANLTDIRRAVDELAGDEEGPAQSQELQRKLAQARRLVQLSGRLNEASSRRRWGDVLETSGAVLQVLSGCTEAATARANAAAALEAEADDLGEKGSYDAALAKLAILRRWWPDREGLATRTASLESRRQEVRSIREKIASAETAGREGHPDDGLDVLAGLPARGAFGSEVRALKARLQEQLGSLDGGTPRVSPAPESTMQYEKNQPAVIALKVEDDYRVRVVALFARREGGTGYAQFIAVQEQPETWVIRIPVAFHQNETVEFYATAADPSGHRGELGNEAAPLELKRRRRGLFGR